jgi:hypothetical protein
MADRGTIIARRMPVGVFTIVAHDQSQRRTFPR